MIKKILMISLICILTLAVLAVGAFIVWKKFYLIPVFDGDSVDAITNFDECAKAGNPVMESYPMQCMVNGQTFVQELTPEEKEKLEPPVVKSCSDYEITECPGECSVCPPCEACSSISCQSAEFCEQIGFEPDWYKKTMSPNPEDSICENKCGDGVCQEIVCQASGCPCAETAALCAQDCK